MTLEEMQKGINELHNIYQREKKALYKKYALSNNPYKIGDIITDHIGTLRIVEIGVYVSEEKPQCMYHGIQLNKDGKVSKKQDHTTIYQSNL